MVAAAILLAACSQEASVPVVATGIELSAPRPGVPMRAAYLTIENRSDEVLRITSASSPEFGRVELHETVIENDVARMRPVDTLEIAPGDNVTLERGGLHLMLMQPVPAADRGDEVTLNFFDDDRLVLSVVAGDAGT